MSYEREIYRPPVVTQESYDRSIKILDWIGGPESDDRITGIRGHSELTMFLAGAARSLRTVSFSQRNRYGTQWSLADLPQPYYAYENMRPTDMPCFKVHYLPENRTLSIGAWSKGTAAMIMGTSARGQLEFGPEITAMHALDVAEPKVDMDNLMDWSSFKPTSNLEPNEFTFPNYLSFQEPDMLQRHARNVQRVVRALMEVVPPDMIIGS